MHVRTLKLVFYRGSALGGTMLTRGLGPPMTHMTMGNCGAGIAVRVVFGALKGLLSGNMWG